MNFKLVAVMILCIAAVAGAGCMAVSPDSWGSTQKSQETVHVTTDTRTLYASATPAPIVMLEAASGITQGGQNTAGVDTKIIKTAYLSLEVKDIPGTIEQLKSLAAQSGGYLSSTNMQQAYNNRLSGTVIIRVPSSAFESTLSGAKALGTVKSVSTQGEDVTEEYVDLEARKTSYNNQLAQYNEIMKKAVKVEDVIAVQEQIDRVQTELNRIEGRLKYLNNRIDLSTITVNLEEPQPVGGDSGHSFVTTINEGIAGFVGMIDAIIIILFTLLPLIIIGGAAYGVYRWKKGKKPVVAPADAPGKQ